MVFYFLLDHLSRNILELFLKDVIFTFVSYAFLDLKLELFHYWFLLVNLGDSLVLGNHLQSIFFDQRMKVIFLLVFFYVKSPTFVYFRLNRRDIPH